MAPEDDYKLNRSGRIELIRETKDKTDKLYATNEDGSVNEEKSITVGKGILDNVEMSVSNTERERFTQLPFINDRGKARDIFTFLASNSDVEWGSITTGHKGSQESQTRIMTSHLVDKIYRLNPFIDAYLEEAKTTDRLILEVSHSHPLGHSRFPSGFRYNGSPMKDLIRDREIADRVESNYRRSLVMFGLYKGRTGEWIYYNSKKAYLNK